MTHDMFTKDFFIGNRQRLRAMLDDDMPVVLTANGLMQRSADNTYAFRQDSNFWYLSGIDYPDVVLVMDGAHEYLIVPTRDAVLETFEGRFDPDVLKRVSGVGDIMAEEPGWERLGKRLKCSPQVAGLIPPATFMDFFQFYTNPARARLAERLHSYHDELELLDLRERLAKLRVVKQAPEIAAIRRAVDVTVDGLHFITDPARFAAYQHEYEAEADLTREFRRGGCGHAFDPIVASGRRGTQMHATQNDGPMEAGGMVILDVGAEVSWYAADVARTVMTGQPSKRQQAIYDAVCEAQDYAYSLIRPGIIHKEYEKLCSEFVGEKLKQLGIIKNTKHENVRKHFPHMMSHFVGLEAHDVGDFSQPMQAGSVVVVEPGMYSYDEGLGVRVEDVVVITEDGYEQLSRRLPRQLRLDA